MLYQINLFCENCDFCLGKLSESPFLMDLLKPFDTINHELLIAKLNAYGFSEPSLKLINSYQKDRMQHIKSNSTFSEWNELI